MDQISDDPRALRRAINRRRRALSPARVRTAARQAARLLWGQPESRRCARIAAYFANRGELACEAMIQAAWDRGREVYLPVLHRNELSFAPYAPGTALVPNHYGIPEPVVDHCRHLRPAELDLVLTPLVAVDYRGTRLGMGGGYYDRTFRFLQHRQNWLRPRLIGVGYEFQRVSALDRRAWDVPVQAVVTENGFYRF